MKIIWGIFWQFIFIMFILWWAWFPIVIIWEPRCENPPAWMQWIWDQATFDGIF